ncbi:translation initiation factor eIF-1A [Candidatus Woesearchaeota archaeon CG10_big_fil_rev_8_21_14_0_10_44_13]|nr:MAG: translation initiation factor eIF-1A [Candidatus Woesearchaeota archaeon CG10_big_fil_rev_8_21_14_0_10_44_13]
MGIKKQEQARQDQINQEISRIKLPRGREVIGIVEQRLGGSRMYVRCLDGKKRICRIPGRMKRKLWVRENDIVIVEPWEYDNEKGDILLKYRPTQVEWLKHNGKLKGIEEAEEF